MQHRTSAPTTGDSRRSTRKSTVLWFLAGMVVMANFGLIAYLFSKQNDGATQEVATQTLTSVAPSTDSDTDVTNSAADGSEVTIDPAQEVEGISTTTTIQRKVPLGPSTTTLTPLSELPERGAVYRDGKLYLEGPVPNLEIAQQFVDRAAEVIGIENVVNNYVIRPDAPIPTDGNVRVEQAVLFETASAVIAPEFEPILALGVAVMQLNPQVRMIVEGHTDNVGSDAINYDLSQRRAQSAIAFMVAAGIDPSRFEAVGLGASQPFTTNDTPEGRQINRRIEVQLLDLLAAPAES